MSFALRQLEASADDALISVLRGDFPRGVKKQALFWLGQIRLAGANGVFR